MPRNLQKKEFGIKRDYSSEIVQARSRLWAEHKDQKAKCERDKDSKVVIGFPAKLVVSGKVIRDEFPNWETVLQETRIKTIQGKNQQAVKGQNATGVSTMSSNQFWAIDVKQ